MKNCDEMVNSLLERRNRYVAERKRKKKVIVRTATSLSCVCLVVLLGLGIWKKEMVEGMQPNTMYDSINIGEKDYIGPDDLNDDTQQNQNGQSSIASNNDLDGNSSVTQNANVGNQADNYIPNGNEKTMISSFGSGEEISASYHTPENGKFYFSIPLQNAMDEYADSVLYRVIIDVFSDKEQLSADSSQVKEECERLSSNGYVVAYETFFDGEAYHYYFTLHATYDELTEFIANESYGYFMFLYDERVDHE